VVEADDKETASDDVKREREEEAEVAKLRLTDPEAADALEVKQAKDEKDKQQNKLKTKKKPLNETPWDNRENTDKFRVLATNTVISQLNSGEANNIANAKDVAEATGDAQDKITANSLNLEGSSQNNWHEYWVTKHQV